jgi:uncharacterized protein (TIGR00725 family)
MSAAHLPQRARRQSNPGESKRASSRRLRASRPSRHSSGGRHTHWQGETREQVVTEPRASDRAGTIRAAAKDHRGSRYERKEPPQHVQDLARQIGAEIATRGHIILTGGKPEHDPRVKGASMKATLEQGGRAIGVLPDCPKPFLDDVSKRSALFIGTTLMGGARNFLNGVIPHAVIALEGGPGTVSEITFAYGSGGPIVLVNSRVALEKATADVVGLRELFLQAAAMLKQAGRIDEVLDESEFGNLPKKIVEEAPCFERAADAVDAALRSVESNADAHGYPTFAIAGAPLFDDFDEHWHRLVGC